MARKQADAGNRVPAALKAARAKEAKETVNKLIPKLLLSSYRAQLGIADVERINNPPHASPLPDSDSDSDENSDFDSTNHSTAVTGSSNDNTKKTRRPQIKIRVVAADTLTVAAQLSRKAKRRRLARYGCNLSGSGKDPRDVAILNPADFFEPGGDFRLGSVGLEEDLCMCTTLYPSLRPEFYQLPALGGIWTPDVMVFRQPMTSADGKIAGNRVQFKELSKTEQWFMDVVSAEMLWLPATQEDGNGEMCHTDSKGRRYVERKMRAVMRIFSNRRCRTLVLPAWGVADGHPVGQIARSWKNVILGDEDLKSGARCIPEDYGVREVVFAMENRKFAEKFSEVFGLGLQVEEACETRKDSIEPEDVKELRQRIEDMQTTLKEIQNPDSAACMMKIVENLQGKLWNILGVSREDTGRNVELRKEL